MGRSLGCGADHRARPLTINRGEDDLGAEPLAKGKIRRSGGGRRGIAETDPELVPTSSASSSLPSSAIP